MCVQQRAQSTEALQQALRKLPCAAATTASVEDGGQQLCIRLSTHQRSL
jgi:hypothetical protein